jgi:type IV pilus assembly protein PilY1
MRGPICKFCLTVFALVALGIVAPARSQSTLGQTNQDIDLFLVNPSVAGDRPNVLIIWDNTANWGQQVNGQTAYSIELQALSQRMSALTDQFNVGLMLFSESGNGTPKGSYMRFGVRQTTAVNKTALASLISSLDINADKGSGAYYATAMYEAYLYFGGKNAYAGQFQPKRDYTNNPNNVFAGPLPGNALASATASVYNPPLTAPCQKNFIIFISNGPVDGGENNGTQSILTNLGGKLTTDPIVINPNQEQANWADEFARFLSQSDVAPSIAGAQNIITYTINVYDPAKAGLSSIASHIALMKSMAYQGGGKYFPASDLSSVSAALNQIFQEVNALDSVFASASLPVSVNVRGTNLNQVYIGVFRPDANMAPRWFGNFKEYQFSVDANTNQLHLTDATGQLAYSSTTGFILPTAVSFWTAPSSFWGFRSAAQNGVGGASDSPDGDVVEKGATAQVLRSNLAASQSSRSLLTCVNACSSTPLANTPFNTSTISPGNAAWQSAFGVSNAGYLSPLDGATGQSAELRDIVNWVRGQDNSADENANGSLTDVRASIHGDVLHSKPAVINYNRGGNNDDVYAFYGANDGVFHAIHVGQGSGAGAEVWGFVPSQFFSQLKRLRDNNPQISGAAKKPYFIDGSVGVYQLDVNNDGKLVAADGDKVYLYLTMRRGGPYLIALDVSDPNIPRLLWQRDATSAGYGALGQTWSTPKAAKVRGNANPVLIMGGGYDAVHEDSLPATADSVGRGILVIDAITGDVIWQAGPSPSGAVTNVAVAGMSYSIASDPAVLDRDLDGYADRVYIPDTGGNVWRIDIADASPANWTVNLLASIAGASPSGSRKFLYPPDVVYGSDLSGVYDAVLIGSGDREHPFDTSVTNRFYMFKDRRTGTSGAGQATITETDLYDATSNNLQTATGASLSAAQSALSAAKGWMITLAAAEKVVGTAVTVSGITYFNTNQPGSIALPGTCTSLGVARAYSVGFADATAAGALASGQSATLASRYTAVPGGGYLPSPVSVVLQLDGKIVQGVISGTYVQTPPNAQLNWRHRVFWQIRHD